MKPELFTHGELFDAERESKLPLRLAFVALFTCCDREGRFKWRPRELKLACLPFDEVDFSRVLDALATRGFIVRYASDYGCIPSWNRHQVINNREGQSELPTPSEIELSTRAPRVGDACPTPVKGKGREGKGRGREEEGDDAFVIWWELYERKGSRKLSAEQWARLTPEDRAACIAKTPAYVRSKPDKVYRKDGERYLRNRTWEDEILIQAPTVSAPVQHKLPEATGWITDRK